jgi:hypothetical protein
MVTVVVRAESNGLLETVILVTSHGSITTVKGKFYIRFTYPLTVA